MISLAARNLKLFLLKPVQQISYEDITLTIINPSMLLLLPPISANMYKKIKQIIETII